jgi:putative DNA primase/helicase
MYTLRSNKSVANIHSKHDVSNQDYELIEKKHNINHEQAERFLAILDDQAKYFTFQTFDDDKDRKDRMLARVLHGSYDKHKAALEILNRQGAGIFVTINATDGKGRKLQNIQKPRAVWIEDDMGLNKDPPGLEPHIIIRTSGNKNHRYFLIDDGENVQLEDWKAVMKRLVVENGGDGNAIDLPRVLRLPGYFHQKDPANPQLVHIIRESGAQPYRWEKIIKAIPPVLATETKKPEPGAIKYSANLTELVSALEAIDPDSGYKADADEGYNYWLKIGMAIHEATQGSLDGLSIFDNWSQRGANYPKDPDTIPYKWNSFGQNAGQKITASLIFKLARKNGWQGLSTEDALKMHLAEVRARLPLLQDDKAAMHSDVTIRALRFIQKNDRQEFARINTILKSHRIANEIKQMMRLFSTKEKYNSKPADSASKDKPSGKADSTEEQFLHDTLHQACTNPAPKPIKQGCLTLENPESGKLSLVAHSEAVNVVAQSFSGIFGRDSVSKTWFFYCGTHWEPLPDSNQLDVSLIRQLEAGCFPVGFQNHYRNGVKDLLADGGFLPPPKNIPGVLPFRNGILDLTTRQLDPVTPLNAQTWCLPYDYNAQADCPTIKTFIRQCANDNEAIIMLLRAWLNAVLMGRADLQKFLALIGPGGTGKGTLMRLATALIGQHNAATTNLKELENNRFELANFYGKRLVMITDSDKYGGSINNLKAMTGQDWLRLERKNKQQSGGFIYEGMVVIAANEQLAFTDHSSGLERRRVTIPLERRVTNEEKEAWKRQGGEAAVLHCEMPGLVNWLLELTQEDVTGTFHHLHESILMANLKAMIAGNPVTEWLLANCIYEATTWTRIGVKKEIREPGAETSFEDSDRHLYPNYLQWAQRNARHPCSIVKFRENVIDAARSLEVVLHESRKSEGQGITGLRLAKQWKLGNWHDELIAKWN